MPELPEVETIRRALVPAIDGRRFVAVEARRPDLRFPLPERFAERLTGARVQPVARRGKHLVLGLDTGESLIWHLGMSGRVTIIPVSAPSGTPANETPGAFTHARAPLTVHDHVIFEVEGGARVVFNDPRRFGFMHLVETAALEQTGAFAGMGPEPLSNAFNPLVLTAKLAGRRSAIKTLLLDQRLVAGLGNIYVCEALFRARIAPQRPGGGLTPNETATLVAAIQDVLRAAIEAGGSTLRDYAQADGALGYFQLQHDVYGRGGEPCRRPECVGRIVRSVQGQRSTFSCEACQV